jgi:hypothetical protein
MLAHVAALPPFADEAIAIGKEYGAQTVSFFHRRTPFGAIARRTVVPDREVGWERRMSPAGW